MGWSRENAANAYLDTLKLRAQESAKRNDAQRSVEPECNEFISALAAGMGAKLIVEVSPQPSQSTVALAAAARQTGGRLVCIFPDEAASTSTKEVIDESGLRDIVEFKVGDPHQLLPEYENIDFSLVDCKSESYPDLLKLLDVNPRRSVVVANHLEGGKEGLRGDVRGLGKDAVRSLKRPIGEGMEVTVIGKMGELGGEQLKRPIGEGMEVTVIGKMGELGGEQMKMMQEQRKGLGRSGTSPRPMTPSKWVRKIDESSGEEHFFRLPQSL